MDRWIADIVVCLAFYFVYHRFYIKHCKKQWIKEISQKVAERLEKKKEKEMIKYKGYIIEHEFGFGGDKYCIYEPKHWKLVHTFQNHELCDVKKYIDKRINEQK